MPPNSAKRPSTCAAAFLASFIQTGSAGGTCLYTVPPTVHPLGWRPANPAKTRCIRVVAGACTASPCQSGAVLAANAVFCGASLRLLRIPTRSVCCSTACRFWHSPVCAPRLRSPVPRPLFAPRVGYPAQTAKMAALCRLACVSPTRRFNWVHAGFVGSLTLARVSFTALSTTPPPRLPGGGRVSGYNVNLTRCDFTILKK